MIKVFIRNTHAYYLGGTMKTFIELHQNGRYNKIFAEKDTINSVSFTNDFLIHKQIERRNGFTYMRIKKRGLDALN